MPEQSIKILALLLEKPGDVVLREEIRRKLWPNDTVVEFDHSINAAVKRLRQALDDAADNPEYIETLARRGYRWIAPVEREAAEVSDTVPVKPQGAMADTHNLIGRKVSHYRVLELLGGGGMGVVYKAEDLKLGRRVALKFLPEELVSDPAALKRFESEARAASALNHPNICTIYEVEEYAGQPFIVMELLDGQTVRDLIMTLASAKLALELAKLRDLAIQISAGLEAAHQQGIIHRDIKPANIFITSQGQAKILDFGLAKLSLSETAAADLPTPNHHKDGSQHKPNHETESLTASSPFLSRTGVAMGTAGYMSPEQIRGQKLDPRTDLFSFGLVLYEMATGQRAFTGDTAPALHNSILNHAIAPVHELNANLPARLEAIIIKALEKDREARYQTASEIRADLESFKHDKESKAHSTRWRKITAAAGAALFVAFTVLWFAKLRPTARQYASPELKLRQLTSNSFENRVTSGGLSPDGKYLAYSDTRGLYVKRIETGVTRAVPRPKEFKDENVGWQWTSWFPDSTGFVVNAHRSGTDPNQWDSHESSIWVASVLGGASRKLRDSSIAWSVSPDGSLIGFGTNKGQLGEREIWVMGASGDQARKLFAADGESSIGGLIWSPDGKRGLYTKFDQSGGTLLSRDLEGGSSTTILGPGEMKQVNDLLWLADGRLLYSVAEPETFFPNACNFWEMQLDKRTGEPSEKPKRLTNWSGFCMSSLSETSDGKKLAFLKWAGQETSFLADLAGGGTRILRPRHFPLSESSDGTVGWTPDSKAIFFVSNRSSHEGIYKQFLGQDIAEPVVTEGYGRNARLTPDGKSIVYLGIGENGPWPAWGPEPVMRVSIAGGPSQLLFTARPWSLITCASPPSELCVIGEPTDDRKQLAVSVLDPMKGRGSELFRFALVANDDNWFLDLRPDGTRVAVTKTPAGPIYILSLSGQVLQQVQVKGWSNLQSLTWAADGKALFVTAGIRNGREILHVDLQGNAHALWENTGSSAETLAHPSPDGRHLTFEGWTTNSNMWMLENF